MGGVTAPDGGRTRCYHERNTRQRPSSQAQGQETQRRRVQVQGEDDETQLPEQGAEIRVMLQHILHRLEVEGTLREQQQLLLMKIKQQQSEDASERREQQANLLQIQQQLVELQQGNGTANAGNNAHDMKESQQDNVLNEDDASHVTSLRLAS